MNIRYKNRLKSFIDRFDKKAANMVMALPKWLAPAMHWLSIIGHPAVTVGLMAVVGILGLIHGNNRLILATILAVITPVVNYFLKIVIHRVRPSKYNSKFFLWVDTYSFPSAHTSSSTVTYGLIAYLLWSGLAFPLNLIVAVILIMIIIGIGFSRVYVGVHYPTDVLAGWMLGLLGFIIIAEIIKPVWL